MQEIKLNLGNVSNLKILHSRLCKKIEECLGTEEFIKFASGLGYPDNFMNGENLINPGTVEALVRYLKILKDRKSDLAPKIKKRPNC